MVMHHRAGERESVLPARNCAGVQRAQSTACPYTLISVAQPGLRLVGDILIGCTCRWKGSGLQSLLRETAKLARVHRPGPEALPFEYIF